jgi:hypothetical protein
VTQVEFDPDVQIACLVGGYVLTTYERDPEKREGKDVSRVCLSIDEVVAHVRRTLEAIDQHPEREYPKLPG